MSDWWTACSFSGGRHMLMSLAVLFCKYLRLPATTVSCEWLVFTLGENFQRKLAPMTLPVPVIPVGQLIVKSTKSMVQTIYLNSHQSLSFQVELTIKTKIWVNLCYNFLPTYVGYTVSSLRFKWLTRQTSANKQSQSQTDEGYWKFYIHTERFYVAIVNNNAYTHDETLLFNNTWAFKHFDVRWMTWKYSLTKCST